MGELYDQDDEEFWDESNHQRRQRSCATHALIALASFLIALAATLIIQWIWR